MTEYEKFLIDNHIKNLKRAVNGKSAQENYKDILEEHREAFDLLYKQPKAKIDEKALNDTICKAAEKAIRSKLDKIFK